MVIDEEIKKADTRLAAGVGRGALYADFIKGGLEKKAAPPPAPARPGQPEQGVAYQVPVGNAPIKGPKDALVTIVQFSDFQCPYCSRVEPTVTQVMDAYKGKVRVAWKDHPLPPQMHPNAMSAAIAGRAAAEQGRFWDMHDKLFANQQSLTRDTFEKLATELHLNLPRFKAALDAQKGKSDIEAETAFAERLGAGGTPAFFINGVFLSGAQPFENFKNVIDEQLKKAEELVAKGTPKAKVYDAIMKTAKTQVAAAPAQPQAAAEPPSPDQDTKVWPVTAGDAPVRGPKNAPVSLIVFSDFQCPFCKRVEPTLSQIEKEYPGKVKVLWKNMPLDMHPNAKPAAIASVAAGEQGKFWEMHDKLFENQHALDRASLEKYAQDLGLDMAKFRADLDDPKIAAKVQSDMNEGSALKVDGTPATFVNGRKIPGAYPYDVFKKMVDQELSKRGQVAARRRG
jgi:protein-disulfide isomerase